MSKFKIKILNTGTAVTPLTKQIALLQGCDLDDATKIVESREFVYDESTAGLIPIRCAKESLEEVGATVKLSDVK